MLISCLMIVQRGIGFLRSFYVCGTLTPDEVGRWDLAFNFLMLAAPLAVFGIPGSFGRYLARFENNGGQSRFLRQTLLVCLLLAIVASLSIGCFKETVARYFLGDSGEGELVKLLAIGLPVVIFFNFATSWFSGRRLNRFVFRIQFTQTVFFALLCIATFGLLSKTAHSVIVSYLCSCVAGMVLAVSYTLVSGSRDTPGPEQQADDPIWRKILPFAVWVWVSNTLVNLFSLCDRLLLVNFYPQGDVDLQSLVGQYHTACIFPLLLMSIGAMAASTGIPYLSKDWEDGQREAVADRLNLMLKAIGLFCVLASVGILLVAPILFGEIWKDKFAMGESLLPMTLCYCSLAAMTFVAQKYFWCLEKTWISSGFLLIGLITNFLVGVALIGSYGIDGVVASTLVAHGIVLSGLLLTCKRYDLRVDRGVFIVAVAVLSVCLGKLIASICLLVLVAASIYTSLLFSKSERQLALGRLRSISYSFGGKVT